MKARQLATLPQLLTVLRRTGSVKSTTDELLFGVLRSNLEDLHHAEPIIRHDAHESLASYTTNQVCSELGISTEYFKETVEQYYLNYRVEDWLLANDEIFTKFCDGLYVGLRDIENLGNAKEGALIAVNYEYKDCKLINPQALPADTPPVIAVNTFKRPAFKRK